MSESFDRACAMGAQSESCGWRAIVSAWLVALVSAALFAIADAIASAHGPPPSCELAGAVIPRHDPSLPGADEIAASDWLERVRAEPMEASEPIALHLMDGGISENLALRVLLNDMLLLDIDTDRFATGLLPVRRILIISVDGQSAPTRTGRASAWSAGWGRLFRR